MIGETIHRFETTDSTNDRAKELARQGAPEGVVVVSEAQTAGRGRYGRSWESPAGKNLYFSILLRPKMTVEEAPRLTVVSGIAIAKFLRKEIPLQATLKWPNDIYYRSRKMGGILSELEIEKEKLSFVVVGIGLNLNSHAGDFSPDLQKTATSLFLETGREWDREKLLRAFFPYFEEEYRRFPETEWAELKKRFVTYEAVSGTPVLPSK